MKLAKHCTIIRSRLRKLPRVLSCRIAKHPRHNVVVYANIQSRSRGTRIIHTATAVKRGRNLRWFCSCEAKSFNPLQKCIHVKATILKLRRRAA